MQISKKTLATVLIGLASVIGIVSIFCFFGAAFKSTLGPIEVKGPSMFLTMFGGTWTVDVLGEVAQMKVELKAGMTILFVIELIILLLSVVIIAGNVAKKLKDNTTICLASIVALLTLVAVIMSFCTVKIIAGGDSTEGAKLGAGPISFSILGIVGIISNVAGIIVYKKSK